MKPNYDCIIIGTGVGGSACGAILAHNDVKVLILEKNHRIGGSCSYYEKNGFRVDSGTHMFSRGNRGPFGEVQRRIAIPNRIKFLQIPNLVTMKAIGLDLIFPSSLLKLPGFFFRLFRGCQIRYAEWPSLIRLFLSFMVMSDRKIKNWDYRSLDSYISNYTSNPAIHGYFAFLFGHFFLLPWWEASAGEAIWSYKRMFRANTLSYPKGGAVQIPKAFLETAKRDGAEVITEATVTRILVKDNEVQGVEMNDGKTYDSRKVVSTTSLKDSVFNLIGEEYFPSDYIKRITDIRGSLTAVQAKIALDKKLIDEGCVVAVTPLNLQVNNLSVDLWRGFFNDIKQGKIPSICYVYCPIPTNFDPNLAPKGKQLLTACAMAPTTDIVLQDSAEKWIDHLMKSLRELVPQIDEHTLWCDTFSVGKLANWIGKTGGHAITTAQTPDQVGTRRPSVKSPIKGLYFAGDCTGGRGIGTELAAQSGIECADIILRDSVSGQEGP